MLLDGWILRFSRGFTKRANCIVPLYASTQSRPDRDTHLDKLRYCENLYAREQQQTIVRLTTIDESAPDAAAAGDDPHSLDAVLAERGYTAQERTLVLTRELTHIPHGNDTVTLLPLDEWLSAYSALTGTEEPARTLHKFILRGIAGECGCAVISRNGEPVACGLAVVERELVGLFDVYTRPELRQQGLAENLVAGLLNWAENQGAQRAYLQVLRDNTPALRLYRRLDFLLSYEYWYRIAP